MQNNFEFTIQQLLEWSERHFEELQNIHSAIKISFHFLNISNLRDVPKGIKED